MWWTFRRQLAVCTVVGMALLAAAVMSESAAPATPDELLRTADASYENKNYADAARDYERLLELAPEHPRWFEVGEQVIDCYLRLEHFNDALEAAYRHVERSEGTYHEARAVRLLGSLYLTLPKWGTRAGGEFHRGEYRQGLHVVSYRHDKNKAIKNLERARELYAEYALVPDGEDVMPAEDRAGWADERVEAIFDLAGACSRFGIFENQPYFWHLWWGQRDDELAETAGQDDFDEQHSLWQYHRKRPIGLRVDAQGRPVFPTRPDAYRAELDDDQKVLYLLHEARQLDPTDNAHYTALSWLRQAMLSRSRFGMDRLHSYVGWHAALQEQVPEIEPWELDDSEAIVVAGGSPLRITLPETWDIQALLAKVVTEYPDSGVADEAQYATGLYRQSRQQYAAAIQAYETLRETFPDSPRVINAQRHINHIRQAQVTISPMAAQLPGDGVSIQVTHRNTERIWFVARSLDIEGLLRELRDDPFDELDASYRGAMHSALRSWQQYLVRPTPVTTRWVQRTREIVAEHVGPEVERWSAPVVDDGTHRAAEQALELPSRLRDQRGGYVVYAYIDEPDAADAQVTGLELLQLGASRAVTVVQDVALVEKRTDQGRLYLVADAGSGAPLRGAEVEVLETWTTVHDQPRYQSQLHNLTTDDDGFAVLADTRPNRQLHALVTATDGRMAWSGMEYDIRYRPSALRRSTTAYFITDRPVYRPGQEVRFKAWVRHFEDGQIHNVSDTTYTVQLRDAQGNTVHTMREQTDEFGGIDGRFTLDDDAPLGGYVVRILGIGSAQFRVEEYQKPEFEVTVEPGTDHAKLGELVTATIRADYYFGAPVSDGEVTYRVYREEYRHRYYFPSRWDWLYGPGYGLPWYSSEWFPWWRRQLFCWVPPGWWHGARFSPVRELVSQGDGRLSSDGTLEVEIDTAPAAADHGDRDHKYIVEAEVRDPSRRIITGQGEVKVTRQAYFATIQADRGHYRPGDEMLLRIRLLTPGGRPVATEGTLTVSEVEFARGPRPQLRQQQLEQWQVEADETGLIEQRLRHEKSGQLKVHFEAPDEWGGTVEAVATIWVVGRDFEGRLHRFNDLELITDQRSYQAGDTARIMLNTDHADSYVLLATELDGDALVEYRLVHVPEHTKVIELPIRREHAPNFFIEAVTIHAARTHTQHLQINVPPADGVMDVTVETDQPRYEPGEQATVTVTATRPDGTPARAQLALSAFDRSLLYIAEETAPHIAEFFHGNLRRHTARTTANLTELHSAQGNVTHPFRQLHPMPDSWQGVWGPVGHDWPTEGLSTGMGGMGGMGMARSRAPGRGVAEDGEVMEQAARARPLAAAVAPARAGQGPGAAPDAYVEAEVRTEFADSALWLATLTTDDRGRATHTFTLPENLTTWKINAWGTTTDTRVGQADTEAVSTKGLLVRLQAPRHFVERDEVVLSANVHNYLASHKTARVRLALESEVLELIDDPAYAPLQSEIEIPADGQRRVDWRVRVRKPGEAVITVTAQTDEQSDAMRMSFPAIVYGSTRQLATTGIIRPDEHDRTVTVELDIPEQRKPELTYLEVQFAPSLIGTMMDALPYMLDYPYHSSDHTISRFLPAVLTLKTLRNMEMDLEQVREVRGRLDEVRQAQEDRRRWSGAYAYSPIFDSDEMDQIIRGSLRRLASTQHQGGGWSWWPGGEPTIYVTSYVLYGLLAAEDAGVDVDRAMIDRGLDELEAMLVDRMQWPGDRVHTTSAFGAYVLSLRGRQVAYDAGDDERGGSLVERLWVGRDALPPYGKTLLALTLANLGDQERGRIAYQNVLQYVVETPETESAHIRVPRGGWWYWWNNDIETTAWALRAVVRFEPESELAPRLVRWLLNNRRNGYYWGSTRDTTLCLAAISDFVAATGEGDPDMTVTISPDGGRTEKRVHIDRHNFFTYDNRFILEGRTLTAGRHDLTIRKEGRGTLYFNTYLRYFTQEDQIDAAGHELTAERTYYRLVQMPFEVEVEDAGGRTMTEQRLRYERVPIADGEAVDSGDLIQVELKLTTDNHYTFLAVEDMKPAGFEPVALTSGMQFQEGFWAYMEVRDQKTGYFIEDLDQGSHLLRYRLRAEVPGTFHALPTQLYGMYVPQLRANSESRVLKIVD